MEGRVVEEEGVGRLWCVLCLCIEEEDGAEGIKVTGTDLRFLPILLLWVCGVVVGWEWCFGWVGTLVYLAWVAPAHQKKLRGNAAEHGSILHTSH